MSILKIITSGLRILNRKLGVRPWINTVLLNCPISTCPHQRIVTGQPFIDSRRMSCQVHPKSTVRFDTIRLKWMIRAVHPVWFGTELVQNQISTEYDLLCIDLLRKLSLDMSAGEFCGKDSSPMSSDTSFCGWSEYEQKHVVKPVYEANTTRGQLRGLWYFINFRLSTSGFVCSIPGIMRKFPVQVYLR